MNKIVTIKLPKNSNHDPHNKVVGSCPFTETCTDSTGEHHSGLRTEEEIEGLRQSGYHITRIEDIPVSSSSVTDRSTE